MTEEIIYRFRTGTPWRDLPESFGPWQTVWKRHHRFSIDGTWDKILTELLTQADAGGLIEWEVSVDSTVNRAHQHGTNLGRVTGGGLLSVWLTLTCPMVWLPKRRCKPARHGN